MPHEEDPPSFTAAAEIHSFNALLFDMDGTIIDSTNAIVKSWHKYVPPFERCHPFKQVTETLIVAYLGRIGEELGVDPNVILATSHGRRSIDVIREYEPGKANWDYIREIEERIPKEFGADATEVPGSRRLLEDLEKASVPWAIVTSGTRPLVTGWLDVMKLAHPQNLVVAEDVQQGKPDPTCYQMGASKLKLTRDAAILVLEDAPAGVRAGKAAGFQVVGLATTHTVRELKDAGADWIVRDMRSVIFKGWDSKTGTVSIEIDAAFVA